MALTREKRDALQQELVARLKALLATNGWTQRGLANATGISEKHLSFILNGKGEASVKTWDLLLDVASRDAR